MKTSLGKDTLFYSLSNWGQRLLSIVLTPVTIAYFSPADFGYIALATTVSSFLFIVGMLAVADQGLPRFFMDAADERERKGYVAAAVVVTLCGNAAVVGLLALLAPAIPLVFADVARPAVFAFLVAALCVTQSYSYVGTNLLRWTSQSHVFARINLVKTAVSVAVAIFGIVRLGWRVRETLLLTAVLNLLAGAWANRAVRSYLDLSLASAAKVRELLRFSWPLLGLNVFAFFSLSLNRVLLARLAGLHELGIYSVSTSVAALFETATSGFFFATAPYFLATYKEAWAPKRYAEYFALLSAAGVASVAFLGLWGAPVVTLFRPDGTYRGIGVFIPWILAGTVLYYLGAYFAPGPYLAKKTHLSFVAFLLSTVLNVAFCYLLIPRFGLLGCGVAVSLSSLAAAVFNQVASNRLYRVPNRWPLSFSAVLGMAAVTSALQHEACAYNVNGAPLLARAGLTALLLAAGALPFYRDIKGSDAAERARRWVAGKRA